jgi:phage terminase large subunit-like protein
LHELTAERLQKKPLVDWRKALHLSGSGSGRQRAREIWKIYTEAAPVVTDVPTREAIEFMDTMRELFRDAVKEAGAEVV